MRNLIYLNSNPLYYLFYLNLSALNIHHQSSYVKCAYTADNQTPSPIKITDKNKESPANWLKLQISFV